MPVRKRTSLDPINPKLLQRQQADNGRCQLLIVA